MAEEEIRGGLIGAGGNIRNRHIPGFAGVVTALVRLGRRGMGGLRGNRRPPREPGSGERPAPQRVPRARGGVRRAARQLPHIPGKGWGVVPDQVLDASAIGRALADAAAGRPGHRVLTARERSAGCPVERGAAKEPDCREAGGDPQQAAVRAQSLQSAGGRHRGAPRRDSGVRARLPDANRNGLEGEDLKRFNRLLLEDAYPAALRRINEVRLAAIFAQRYAKPTPRCACPAVAFVAARSRSGSCRD